MRYTITNTRKPYTSPELSIHELRFEGALLDVSGSVPGMPWGAPRLKRIQEDEDNEEAYKEAESL